MPKNKVNQGNFLLSVIHKKKAGNYYVTCFKQS